MDSVAKATTTNGLLQTGYYKRVTTNGLLQTYGFSR